MPEGSLTERGIGMEKTRFFLAKAAIIFKVLAWISAVFFLVVSVVVVFGAGGPDTPRAASIIFLVGGAIYFLILFTIAQALVLLVNMSAQIDEMTALLQGRPSQQRP
jgi:membrane-bound acyltransferase YfiQ involved in biofilm formation